MQLKDIDQLDKIWDFSFRLPCNKVMSTNTISAGLFTTDMRKRMALRGAFMGSKTYIQKITDDYIERNELAPVADSQVGEVFCVGGPSEIQCDPANFIAGVEKFVTDRFVHAGLLSDDNGQIIPTISIITLPNEDPHSYAFRQIFYHLH